MQGGVRMGLMLGSAISLVISDPFELAQTLRCEIAGLDSFESGADVETILVRTPSPLVWQARAYEYLALRGHSAAGIVDELTLGVSVECGGIGVGDSRRAEVAPWGYDAWRGGLAVRARVGLPRDCSFRAWPV